MSRPLGMGDDSTSLKERITSLEKAGAYAMLYYDDIKNLEGKLLTLLDASISDQEQRQALKSLTRQMVWFNWVESLERSQPDMPVGMPGEGVNS